MVEPPPTHGYVIAEKILGMPAVRAALLEANPEVAGRLEGLVGTAITTLELTAAHFIPGGDGTVLDYEATAATNDFYSDPVAALTRLGVIQPHAQVGVEIINAGEKSEFKSLDAQFDGFELHIDVFHPGYHK